MKRLVVAGLAGLALLAPTAMSAEAATRFANCTDMHKVYKHGVAKSQAAANKQVKAGYGKPAVKPAVYDANRKSDRDNDGTACEA